MSAEKLYPIASHDSTEWYITSLCYPGVTPAGEQFLLFLFPAGQRMYAFRFDAAGRYLGRLERALAQAPPGAPSCDRAHGWLEEIRGWAEELGVAPAVIRVRKFRSEHGGLSLYVEDHPTFFEGDDLGPEPERGETLRWWRDLGAFVLGWDGSEHWLSAKGVCFL
jgi:hypothetical protein